MYDLLFVSQQSLLPTFEHIINVNHILFELLMIVTLKIPPPNAASRLVTMAENASMYGTRTHVTATWRHSSEAHAAKVSQSMTYDALHLD